MSEEPGTAVLPAESALRRDATTTGEARARSGGPEEPAAATGAPRPGSPRRRRLKIALATLLALAAVLVVSAFALDRAGWKFFHTGKSAVETLAQMGKALAEGDLATFEGVDQLLKDRLEEYQG